MKKFKSQMSMAEKKEEFLKVFLSSDLTVNGIFKDGFDLYNRTTHYQYLKKDPEYAAAIAMGRDKNERHLEAAEDALMKNVAKGNQKAIEFVLTHLGGDKWKKADKKIVEHTVRPVAAIEFNMNEDQWGQVANLASANIPENEEELDILVKKRLGEDFKASMEDEAYEFDD